MALPRFRISGIHDGVSLLELNQALTRQLAIEDVQLLRHTFGPSETANDGTMEIEILVPEEEAELLRGCMKAPKVHIRETQTFVFTEVTKSSAPRSEKKSQGGADSRRRPDVSDDDGRAMRPRGRSSAYDDEPGSAKRLVGQLDAFGSFPPPKAESGGSPRQSIDPEAVSCGRWLPEALGGPPEDKPLAVEDQRPPPKTYRACSVSNCSVQ